MSAARKIQQLRNELYLLRNNPPRIGDVQRDKAVGKLGNAFASGYISKTEYDERTEIVLSSKYEHEMDWAFNDLPADIPSPEQEVVIPEHDDRPFWTMLAVLITAIILILLAGIFI